MDYITPDIKIVELDVECICGNPHSQGDWKPGDGKPPWAGGHAAEYRNTLWDETDDK